MAAVYKALSKHSQTPTSTTPVPTRTKQRVLILSSRGVTFRHRHLLNDLYSLLPHSRKDAKLDTKTKLYQLNELAELYNCNNILFFEARKGKDLYIWMSKAPNGPTVKFHLQNCTHQASAAERPSCPARADPTTVTLSVIRLLNNSHSTHHVRTTLPRQLPPWLATNPLL